MTLNLSTIPLEGRPLGRNQLSKSGRCLLSIRATLFIGSIFKRVVFGCTVSLSLAIILLAPMAIIGCARAHPIMISIENNSGRVIQSVAAVCAGGVASFGPLEVDESQEIEIRPTGESHIELEIRPANGSAEYRTVDTYFERGYRGMIRIKLNAEFSVEVSATLTP